MIQDKRQAVLNFFGIWRDISSEEAAVLNEIQLRRERIFRKRLEAIPKPNLRFM